MDLDAVLERRRQDAICNGNMIDLAADVDDEQLQRCTDWTSTTCPDIALLAWAAYSVWNVVIPQPSVCNRA